MSFNKLNKIAQNISEALDNQNQVSTSFLALKLNKASSLYPQDQTIGMVKTVIEKIAGKNREFISKGELKDLYNKFYSRNTKFAQLFTDELGEVAALPEVKVYERDNQAPMDFNSYVGDDVLTNALGSLFDNTPVKEFSKNASVKAEKEILFTLQSWNLAPTSLSTIDGNNQFLVVQASYDTPKGNVHFYVPVELNGKNVIQPSMFMGNSGPKDLNYNNVKDYIKSAAGVKFRLVASDIVSILTKAASQNREISDVEFTLAKFKASKSPEAFAGQVTGLTVEAQAVSDVVLPKSEEYKTFEEKLNSPEGLAEINFGNAGVKAAKDLISKTLKSFGYDSRVSVIKSDAKTVFYGVATNNAKLAFTVPVKFENKKPNLPAIVLCNGTVVGFNKSALSKLATENAMDHKVAAVASAQYGLKPSELVENVRVAMLEGNTAMAEDSLNILAQNADEKVYKLALDIYMKGLAGKLVKAEISKCGSQIQNSTSQHTICAHTGLPVHKVYQDNQGNCRPLYRKGMDETYQGATFMNAKIFG